MSRNAFAECLKRGKLKPFSRGKALAPKEVETAATDLERAEKTFNDGDYKWATIQLYYAMFHSARSLLYAKGLREHSHYCLAQAIRVLYVETKQTPLLLIEGLEQAKHLREDADYYNRWSQAGCEKLLKTGREFYEHAKKLVKKD